MEVEFALEKLKEVGRLRMPEMLINGVMVIAFMGMPSTAKVKTFAVDMLVAYFVRSAKITEGKDCSETNLQQAVLRVTAFLVTASNGTPVRHRETQYEQCFFACHIRSSLCRQILKFAYLYVYILYSFIYIPIDFAFSM